MEFIKCKCGSLETYKSFSGNTCCYPCFKPLEKKEPVKSNSKTAYIRETDCGWDVKVAGVVKEHFSKYEDCASNDARNYCNKLNSTVTTRGTQNERANIRCIS